jgi:hypothetical protein
MDVIRGPSDVVGSHLRQGSMMGTACFLRLSAVDSLRGTLGNARGDVSFLSIAADVGSLCHIKAIEVLK